ncbi:MAG: hypothetical protein ACREX4_11120 [Gammaproteobacteria bacterium]
MYGLGGLGFALGNLLLGRSLPVLEFALFSLVLSLVQLGIPLGPIGLNVIIIRNQLDPDPTLLFKVILTSSAVGLVLAVVANAFYGIEPLLLALLFASIIAGAAGLLAAAHYQREHRFGSALRLTQGPNFLVLLAAIVPSAIHLERAWVPCLVIAVIYGTFAASGWKYLLAERSGAQTESAPFPWHEGLTIVAGHAALIFMIQVERLIIPMVLAIEDLATFAILTAIVGSPFRILQQGVGHTLLPRLRAAGSSRERNRLLFVEAAIVTFVMALTCAVVWVVTPLLVDWLLAGRYTLAPALVLAALISGLAKVLGAFGMTIVGAVGSTKDLRVLSVLNWVSVGIGLAGALIGARWGLVGLVYGVGGGWLAQGLACLILAYHGLCRPHIN